jgi:hypothetical protein
MEGRIIERRQLAALCIRRALLYLKIRPYVSPYFGRK